MALKENKYKNWVFTINEKDEKALPTTSSLKQRLDSKSFDEILSYVVQPEKGNVTGRYHFQGALSFKNRKRFDYVLKYLLDILSTYEISVEQITIDHMHGTWDEAFAYCTKSDTKVDDYITSNNIVKYEGSDISLLDNVNSKYPWQSSLFNAVFNPNTFSFKTPHDREIIWVTDKKGNSGKSKFVKHICFNTDAAIKVPFGTSSQMRSAIISAGPKRLYIIDMPRTMSADDNLCSIISLIEDVKNGFVVSSMYGKYEKIMFDPPHIIIFSNMDTPTDLMSEDRWVSLYINDKKEVISLQQRVFPWLY